MKLIREYGRRMFADKPLSTAVAVTLLTVGIVMSIILVAGWLQKQQKEHSLGTSSLRSSTGNSTGSHASATPSADSSYSLSQVAQHSSTASCWMIIGNSVYDLTKFIGQHPGGTDVILRYCGKDGTQAFATKDRGSSHSSSANQLKEEYRIGSLAQ